MALKVWHNKNFLDFEKYKYGTTDIVYLPKEDFSSVAILLNTNYVEEGFHFTQNIDYPWAENAEVIPTFGTKGCRSTSVGDVIERFAGDEVEYFIVMPVGYKKFKFLESPDQAYEVLNNDDDALKEGNFRLILKYLGTKYLLEKDGII